MWKLGLFLVVPYLAVASVATGAVDGSDTFDAIQNFVTQVSEQSDDVATAIVDGKSGLDHKITICHLPGGDPNKAHLLSIDLDAWPAHRAHGDYELTSPALLAEEPLMSRCADDTEVASDELSDEDSGPGKAPAHSNAGGNGGKIGQAAGGGDGGPPGRPAHSNAGGNGRGQQADD